MTSEEMVAEIVARLTEKQVCCLRVIDHYVKHNKMFVCRTVMDHTYSDEWSAIKRMRLCSIMGLDFVFSSFGRKVADALAVQRRPT